MLSLYFNDPIKPFPPLPFLYSLLACVLTHTDYFYVWLISKWFDANTSLEISVNILKIPLLIENNRTSHSYLQHTVREGENSQVPTVDIFWITTKWLKAFQMKTWSKTKIRLALGCSANKDRAYNMRPSAIKGSKLR